jgi:hypothetical protein
MIGSQLEAVVLILSAVLLINLVIVMVQGIRLNRLRRSYRTLMRGASGKDFETILLGLVNDFQHLQTDVRSVESSTTRQGLRIDGCLQRIGLIRFNAFGDVGGAQSFAVAILDGAGNGLVLSSLYGRDDSRVYAKPVEKGHSTYPLSQEEQQAIDEAVKV